MPFEQTITIINNSGKIISTGKHLVGIFKEARSAYKEKKDALRQERLSGIHRARTFDVSRGGYYHGPNFEVEECDDGRRYGQDDGYRRNHRSLGSGPVPLYLENRGNARRLSLDDGDRRSQATSDSRRRRRRPHRSHTSDDSVSNAAGSSRRPPQPPLTANNLRALSDVFTIRPPSAPQSRRDGRGLYAEPPRHDMVLSRPALDRPAAVHPSIYAPVVPSEHSEPPTATFPSPRASLMVHRPRSDPALGLCAGEIDDIGGVPTPPKPIDMNLAYGSIPPDLALRTDLDPDGFVAGEPDAVKESQARTLVDRIETLLNEAQCIHHTAASIICHLQDNPEAAAAVALTLAELSALLAKLSPAFLGVVKGGSPAVFALLASPQFLIGTSIVVGVTVILFGGWKIVKRISEVRAVREEEKQAFEMGSPHNGPPQQQQVPGTESQEAFAPAGVPLLPSQASTRSYDEALVLEEELSTIETWRRGIEPTMEGDSGTEPWSSSEVDVELISPEAMRSRIDDDDQRTLKSTRSTRSRGHVSSRGGQHRHRQKHHQHHQESTQTGSRTREPEGKPEVPQRQSGRVFKSVETGDSYHSARSHHGDEEGSESGRTTASRSSRYSRRSRSGGDRALDKNGSSGPSSKASTTRSKDSGKPNTGSNMLKQLFKMKRSKDDKERKEGAVSALA
ncbi:hypothetical protein Sste5346_010025 [Sporothrix stenoceras]|uniref:Uncharacterized protein n=1 Tax=Sporothrix stenoceras TaxID=5173 RepID=A0ABR3YHN2_9PEZI